MQPYPSPEPIKGTKKRCQYSLPGRKYDCRRVGKYALGDKQYCAQHYDAKWRFENPEHGPQHDWWEYRGLPCCRICMAVKQYEGLPQGPCRGRARIVLRIPKVMVETQDAKP
jgi:hypothetical protein